MSAECLVRSGQEKCFLGCMPNMSKTVAVVKQYQPSFYSKYSNYEVRGPRQIYRLSKHFSHTKTFMLCYLLKAKSFQERTFVILSFILVDTLHPLPNFRMHYGPWVRRMLCLNKLLILLQFNWWEILGWQTSDIFIPASWRLLIQENNALNSYWVLFFYFFFLPAI